MLSTYQEDESYIFPALFILNMKFIIYQNHFFCISRGIQSSGREKRGWRWGRFFGIIAYLKRKSVVEYKISKSDLRYILAEGREYNYTDLAKNGANFYQ